MLTVGDRIERYTVTGSLGRGGQATVYAVRHTVLGTRHALKVLHDDAPSTRDRLLEEGRWQARMDSPFVVPVHDVLDVSGRPALLMPWVGGGSLAELLEALTPTRDEARALFADIVRGVAHAHGHGLVHRDLKPANVLLEVRWGRVHARVADFGIAALAGQRTSPAGTRGYLAPEVAAGSEDVDAQSDLFSLGAILADLLPAITDSDRGLLDGLREPDPASRRPDSAAALLAALGDVPTTSLGADGRLGAHLTSRDPGDPALVPSIPTLDPDDPTMDDEWGHNLRRERDRFVDRPRALAALRAALAQQGSVTLVGPAGSGKSRLALHVAREQVGQWPGGAWWIDAAPATDGAQLLAAIAQTLSIPLSRSDPWRAAASSLALRGRTLVVVDNVEHLVEPLREGLATLRDVAPAVTWLFTSRALLRTPDESVVDLGPMDRDEARALFLERARAQRPDRELDEALLDTLLARLDDLPLAIELAAARMRLVSVEGLLDQMTDRFRLLVAGQGTRHPTLEAALLWSWDLLEPSDQAALAALSVFEDEFDWAAADAVWGPSDTWALDRLQELVDQSLVQVTDDDRFRLLQSVRDFVAPRLDDVAGARDRHARHFARYGAQALDAAKGRERRARANLRQVFPDLLAASRHAAVRGLDDSSFVGDAAALWHAVAAEAERRGRDEAALQVVDAVLQLPVDDAERGLILFEKGMASYRSWRLPEALAAFAASRERYDAVVDGSPEALRTAARGRGRGWLGQGFVRRRQNDLEAALAAQERAAEEADIADDDALRGLVALARGNLHFDRGDITRAIADYEAAIPLLKAESPTDAVVALANHAGARRRARDPRTAQFVAEALEQARELDVPAMEAHCLHVQAMIVADAGDTDRALSLLDEERAIHHRMASAWEVATTLGSMGIVNQKAGRLEEALALFLESRAGLRRSGEHFVEASFQGATGNVLLELGRADEAYRELASAVDRLTELGNHGHATLARWDLARWHQRFGDPNEGLALVERALDDGRGLLRPDELSQMTQLRDELRDAS